MIKAADPAKTVKDLLTDNWTAGNTDSLTPEIDFITNLIEIDLNNKDYILIYEAGEDNFPLGIGGSNWGDKPIVSIDMRTTYQTAGVTSVRAHLIKMKDEVRRIVEANISNPDATYKLIKRRRRIDLSDKSAGMGRMVQDVILEEYR